MAACASSRLDIDNGPQWTLTGSNVDLYGAARLGRLRGLLVPGGVLSIWAAYRSEEFAAALVEQLGSVEVLTVPVARGDPDVVYLARRYAE